MNSISSAHHVVVYHDPTKWAAVKTLQRLSLRTGVWRGLGDGGPVEPKTDLPLATPAVFQVQRVEIGPK